MEDLYHGLIRPIIYFIIIPILALYVTRYWLGNTNEIENKQSYVGNIFINTKTKGINTFGTLALGNESANFMLRDSTFVYRGKVEKLKTTDSLITIVANGVVKITDKKHEDAMKSQAQDNRFWSIIETMALLFFTGLICVFFLRAMRGGYY